MSFKGLVKGIVLAFRTYPAVTLMLINMAVIIAAHFGYHVTTDQLLSIAIVASGFVGIIVHNAVTPNVRVPNPPMPVQTFVPTIKSDDPLNFPPNQKA